MAKKDNVDLLTSDVDALRSRMSDVENSVVNLRNNGGSSSSQDENRLSRIEGNVTFLSCTTLMKIKGGAYGKIVVF